MTNALISAKSHTHRGNDESVVTATRRQDDYEFQVTEMLMNAVRKDELSMLRKVFAAEPSVAKIRDGSGSTALIEAARMGRTSMVELLLPLSDIDAKTEAGYDALMMASMNGHLGCVKALLAFASKQTKTTPLGQYMLIGSALSLAVVNDHDQIVELLVPRVTLWDLEEALATREKRYNIGLVEAKIRTTLSVAISCRKIKEAETDEEVEVRSVATAVFNDMFNEISVMSDPTTSRIKRDVLEVNVKSPKKTATPKQAPVVEAPSVREELASCNEAIDVSENQGHQGKALTGKKTPGGLGQGINKHPRTTNKPPTQSKTALPEENFTNELHGPQVQALMAKIMSTPVELDDSEDSQSEVSIVVMGDLVTGLQLMGDAKLNFTRELPRGQTSNSAGKASRAALKDLQNYFLRVGTKDLEPDSSTVFGHITKSLSSAQVTSFAKTQWRVRDYAGLSKLRHSTPRTTQAFQEDPLRVLAWANLMQKMEVFAQTIEEAHMKLDEPYRARIHHRLLNQDHHPNSRNVRVVRPRR